MIGAGSVFETAGSGDLDSRSTMPPLGPPPSRFLKLRPPNLVGVGNRRRGTNTHFFVSFFGAGYADNPSRYSVLPTATGGPDSSGLPLVDPADLRAKESA
jgi:hypothetical protein